MLFCLRSLFLFRLTFVVTDAMSSVVLIVLVISVVCWRHFRCCCCCYCHQLLLFSVVAIVCSRQYRCCYCCCFHVALSLFSLTALSLSNRPVAPVGNVPSSHTVIPRTKWIFEHPSVQLGATSLFLFRSRRSLQLPKSVVRALKLLLKRRCRFARRRCCRDC